MEKNIEVDQIDLEKEVKLSNRFIEARYNMRIMEQRFFLLILSQIDKEADHLPDYISMKINDIAKALNLANTHKMYSEIKNAVLALQVERIFLNDGLGNWASIVLFPTILYQNDGTLCVYFNKITILQNGVDIEKELLKLKKAYEKENVKLLISFKTKYAARIYMLIKHYKWLDEKEKTLTMQEIVDYLSLDQQYAKKPANLRVRVLDPAVKEIKSKGNISFDYEYIHQGRKLSAIRFYNIAVKEQKKEIKEDQKKAPAAPHQIEAAEKEKETPSPENDLSEIQIKAKERLENIGIGKSFVDRVIEDQENIENNFGYVFFVCDYVINKENGVSDPPAFARWAIKTGELKNLWKAAETMKAAQEQVQKIHFDKIMNEIKNAGTPEVIEKKERKDNRTEEERIADAGEMNTFLADILLKALENGNIDEDFNILSEDGSKESIQAGLRSVKKYGYTWDDIRAIKRGDK